MNADGYRATYQHGQHPAARLVAETDPDPARVFNAAMIARGRLLLVDSNCGVTHRRPTL